MAFGCLMSSSAFKTQVYFNDISSVFDFKLPAGFLFVSLG